MIEPGPLSVIHDSVLNHYTQKDHRVVHLPFSSFCFCFMHHVCSGVWLYLNSPYSQSWYSQGVPFLENPNTALRFYTDQEEVKVLLLHLALLWYGHWAVVIESHHQLFTRSFDRCNRRAMFRMLIPIISFGAILTFGFANYDFS